MTISFNFTADNFTKKIKSQFRGFPRFFDYVPTNHGDWEVQSKPKITMAGYFSSNSNLNGGIALYNKSNDEVVMSQTAMESESHFLPHCFAQGNVVVAGLGLAVITLNLLMNRAVTRVTVLEIDETLISMFPRILKGESAKLWNDNIASGRLQVIQADCSQPLESHVKHGCGRTIDYLWVDTWSTLGSNESFRITKHLVDELKPKQCDFWGCELYLALNTVLSNPSLKVKPVIDFAQKSGIPFSVLSMSNKQSKLFAQFCYLASKNTILLEKKRNLYKSQQSASLKVFS